MTLSTDPICFARTSSGDLEIPLRLASGIEAVVIGVRARLLLFAGEWFLDLDRGIPYLPSVDGSGAVGEREALLGQPFDEQKTRAAFRREILSAPNVVELLELRTSYDGANRRLSITWRARTAFGDTEPDTLQAVL